MPGAQAELLRVPHADYGPIKVPDGPPDDRFVYLSDVLPTAWQAVEYADVPPGGSLVVLGLGPIGDMACRIARHRGVETVIGIDLVPERLAAAAPARRRRARPRRARRTDIADAVRDADRRTRCRRRDRRRRHGGPRLPGGQAGPARSPGCCPTALAEKLMTQAGVDRLAALQPAIELVRRGGTISVVGVYGGMTDPLPMMTLFDKQVQLRMGQANVRRWVDDILPLARATTIRSALDDVRHPPPPAGGGAGRLRHVPGQARRRGQGAVPALIAR